MSSSTKTEYEEEFKDKWEEFKECDWDYNYIVKDLWFSKDCMVIYTIDLEFEEEVVKKLWEMEN